MSLNSEISSFLLLLQPKSLICNFSANCFFSLGMSPFDFLFKKKKKKKKRHPILGRRQGEQGWLEDGARLLKEVISSCDGRGCYPIRMFSAKEIEQAIGQLFHDDGIFVYYEGTHEDRPIIIKVYRSERELAFNEIATVTQIKHANVAKLLGCCFEMEQPILIYEKVPFMLSNRLWEANPSSSSLISWEHRLRIAIEIAYAITYLHIGTSRPIVHRNIKCSNILLDEHFKPKLADFSLSVSIPVGETHVTPDYIAGLLGYIAPELLFRGIVSEKSDVFSYGVLFLVLLSGQRLDYAGDTDNDDFPLLKFISNESTEKEERLELILLNGLSMDVRQVEQAMACIEVAVGCLSRNSDERPEIKEVTQQLEQIERGHPLLGRRQGEQGWLEDTRLLEKVISSCNGRGCYPIRMFSAKEIEQAIGHFFHQDKSFYVNYEGTHEDRQIMIKVYKRKREMAFNEIATVTQIKHANVAKLLGCCFEMEQPILIYEKVPFILYNHLFKANQSSSIPISWDHRLRIAIEIAYAVTYLHTANSRPIVHRRIKSSNILLDEHYKPKLADFSFSLTIPFGETHVETSVAGTFGYPAPEHATTGIVSEKTDVYSYGVLLLELLSGMRASAFEDDNDHLWLNLIDNEPTEKEERLELILRNGLTMDVRQVEQAMACMEVAVGCISRNPDERPAMKEVTQQLEQIERGGLPLNSSSLLRVQRLGKCKVE